MFVFEGVLWLHDELFEGTNDVINKLVELGKKVYLITNNNQTTREELAEKCKKMNFNLELVREKIFVFSLSINYANLFSCRKT